MISKETTTAMDRHQKQIWSYPPNGTKKLLSSKYTFHQFHTHPVFIVAGGPTLRGFDFSLLDNKFTIGVNKIISVFQPTITYAADSYVLPYLQQHRKTSDIVICDPNNAKLNDCYYVKPTFSGGIKGNIDFLECGNNSGYGAIHLAISLGFNPIYLLGFDCKFINGKDHVFDSWGCRPGYQNFLATFAIEFHDIQKNYSHLDIVNLSPDSAITCFRRGRIEEVLNETR